MPEPKIICGPILRRVEKSSVSVWVACKNNYRIFLKVYPGKVKHDTTITELTTSEPAEAVTSPFGKNLWITVVTAKLELPLQEGEIYSYDISFRSGENPTDSGDLKTDGFLEDKDHPTFKQLALGYAIDFLPTFSLPSEDPARLFIAHASCRKMHGHGLDALANIDEKIGESIEKESDLKPYARPQQLFLTGDQIYADDVPTLLLDSLGRDKAIVGNEKLRIQKNGGPEVTLDTGNINFPPLLRGSLVQSFAQFTSGSAHNHLLSFWEFAGTYLCYWNLRSWNEKFYNSLKGVKFDDTEKISQLAEKIIDGSPAEGWTGVIPFIEDSSNLRDPKNEFLFTNESDKEAFDENPSGDKRKAWRMSRVNKVKGEISQMIPFLEKLPAVSRVLANVATYMIFDDHEVTDDWNLTKGWVQSTNNSLLGKDVIRNALMAYTIFQDWGNTPDEYVAIGSPGEVESTLTAKTKLLRHISEYGDKLGRAIPYNQLRTEHLDQIEAAFGLNNNASNIKWHYNVDTGPTKTYVLDTRTRRHYASDNAPPGLIASESLTDQIPDSIPNPATPFTFIVSPAPVFALQSFEELVQPAASQFIGVRHKPDPNKKVPEGMTKFDYESWGFHLPTFENFVQRCSRLNKVIILSGDVHYGFSSAMDYWEKGNSSPKSRMVQLTSSAIKNEEFGMMHLYRSALVQKLLTGIGDKIAKLVWKNANLTVTGNVSIRNRQRLRKKPAVLPLAGWQPGATVNLEPDYRYRISVMTDESDRSATDPVTSEINLSDSTSMKNGYKQIVKRHQEVFTSGVHRRMVWPANMGLVKFTVNGSSWNVSHEFIFTKGEQLMDTPKPGVYLKHEIPLVVSGIESTQPELT